MGIKTKQIKFYSILTILLLSGVISWRSFFSTYIQHDTVNVTMFPGTVGGWVAKEIPLTEQEYAILETRNTFVREYTSPKGQKVMLYVIYSQTNRKVAHPPEICFTGSGSTAVTKYQTQLAKLDNGVKIIANEMIFDRNDYHQVMFYVFKVGNSYTTSYLKQQLLIALNTFLGRPSGSALIRFTAVAEKSSDIKTAEKDIMDFASLVMPILPKYVP